MKINIKGDIIPNDYKFAYDYYGMESCCPNDVHGAIERAAGERLDVYVNSGGGSVFAGSEIYAALQEYGGQVFIHIVGLAGSAASFIACAGHCDMVRTGLFMIHNGSWSAEGDKNEMTHFAGILDKLDRAIASAYTAKTGKSMEEILAAMDAESWHTAQECLDLGFVDEIAESKNLEFAASAFSGKLSAQLIDELRDKVRNPAAAPPVSNKARAELKLLELEERK